MAYGDGGSLHEDVHERITCPVRLVVAEQGVYPRERIEAFAHRHPHLPITWLPTGHDAQAERPRELAALILSCAADTRPA